jgi:hypothetical protein
MTDLSLIGIKVALKIIALRVSLMIDYSVLTDRQINHIKVWTHKTRLLPFFHQLFFAFSLPVNLSKDVTANQNFLLAGGE